MKPSGLGSPKISSEISVFCLIFLFNRLVRAAPKLRAFLHRPDFTPQAIRILPNQGVSFLSNLDHSVSAQVSCHAASIALPALLPAKYATLPLCFCIPVFVRHSCSLVVALCKSCKGVSPQRTSPSLETTWIQSRISYADKLHLGLGQCGGFVSSTSCELFLLSIGYLQ